MNKRLFAVLAVLACLMMGIGATIAAAEEVIDDSTAAALNRIQAELRLCNCLSEEELHQAMNQIRNEFAKMEQAKAGQAAVSEVANQACHIIRLRAKNAGELKKLNSAVSLMAQECIKGNNPAGTGQMIREQLKKGRTMDEAVECVQEQIREREQSRDQEQTNAQEQAGTGSQSSGGSGNSGGPGSGGKK
ncbi:MAG: hypothetical protein ACM3WV_05535 [Bacillota bacterium]